MGLVAMYANEDMEIKFREVNSQVHDKPMEHQNSITSDASRNTAASCYLSIPSIGRLVVCYCIVRTGEDLDPRIKMILLSSLLGAERERRKRKKESRRRKVDGERGVESGQGEEQARWLSE